MKTLRKLMFLLFEKEVRLLGLADPRSAVVAAGNQAADRHQQRLVHAWLIHRFRTLQTTSFCRAVRHDPIYKAFARIITIYDSKQL